MQLWWNTSLQEWPKLTPDLWHTNHQQFENEHGIVIDEPQAFDCGILCYIHGHHEMCIEVVDRRKADYEPFYLWLHSVWYFEGPTQWQGIDFRLGSFEECKELVSQGWLKVGDLIDEFVKKYVLLILERPTFRVRILAYRCDIVTEPPNIQIVASKQSDLP